MHMLFRPKKCPVGWQGKGIFLMTGTREAMNTPYHNPISYTTHIIISSKAGLNNGADRKAALANLGASQIKM